ncbi:MAG: polysaccharide biosynthesis/export family protein [Muribaculaceae bacterium]
MKNKLILFLVIVAALQSCKSTQEYTLPYFSNIGTAADGVMPSGGDYGIKVIPDDELIITVNSVVPAATAHYNLTLDNPSLRGEMVLSSTPKLQTYLVNKEGCIDFPVLGKLKVAGMTTDEIKKMLEEKIGKDVDDPYVRVQLANFKVNVLGEVNRPGAFNVTTERFSVLDALANAGDLTEYGNRANVLIIREENGVRQYHRINLNDAATLSSPYYYLQQNDVVYVEPNKIRQDNSKYNQNNAFKLSVISTIVSACSVVASLIIALAVK